MAELLKNNSTNTMPRKKGFEPIVAEILLIVIALAAAIIIWQFYSGFIANQSMETSQTTLCSFAQLNIQDVSISGNRGIVTLKNSGISQIEIINISFLSNSGMPADSITDFPVNMSPGSLHAFYFNISSIPCTSFGSVLVYTSCPNVKPSFYGPARC